MAITDTGSLTGLVQTAYSKAVEFAFQPKLYFSQFAQSKKWESSAGDPMPGNTVTFTIFNALSTATGALNETADPTAGTLGKTQKSVTMYEYGKLVTSSRKLRTLSFANIDLAIGRVVGDNMGHSVDLIARAAWDASTASTYVNYASGSAASSVLSTSIITADDVRLARNRLARNNVPQPDGRFYVAIAHPDVIHDLRAETGNGSWRQPKEYVDPGEIYNGEIGEFEGFRFVETTNAQLQSDGASGTVDLYTSYFLGFQALAYAEGTPPAMGISGPFDAMQRLMNVYWYGLFGFGALRAEALYKVYSSSSVGSNS